MPPVVVAIIVIVVLAAIAMAVMRSRNATPGAIPAAPGGGASTGGAPSVGAGGGDDPLGLRPAVRDFKVEGGEAHVFFDVPLPAGDADEVLSGILVSAAVETLREKRATLPMDGIGTVHAHGMRSGAAVHAGSITLDGPGVLPEAGSLTSLTVTSADDLFDSLSGSPAPSVAVDRGEALPDLASELRFTQAAEAGLRTQGIEPTTASTSKLVEGLLRLGGYAVAVQGDAMVATRGGTRSLVYIVEHGAEDHPELSEKNVNEFMAKFGQSGADRGLLFTAKFGPFMIYDKERRQPKVKFITRERFQTFVDGIAVR